MTADDRSHWDQRYAGAGVAPVDAIGPPSVFGPYEHLFPTTGRALDLACGRGRGAVWLAHRGMHVHGVDVSPVAIGLARQLADQTGVGDRCSFEVVDLDHGLPEGPRVDLILCHLFRDPRLDDAVIERVAPGGLVAVAALSEVDAGPGPYRSPPGELSAAFRRLDVVAAGERDGRAWFLGRA